MVALRLTARDRDQLAALARARPDARQTRRALALLDPAAGQPATRVAARYQVGRSAVHERAARRADGTRPGSDRLRDAARSGRPPDTRDAAEAAAAERVPSAPTAHGYRWKRPRFVRSRRAEHRRQSEGGPRGGGSRGSGRWRRSPTRPS